MVQLKDIFVSLQRHEVRYLLCGGVAVSLYGIPRMTADIDVLIAWSEANVDRFEAALHEHGYKNNLFFQLKTLVSASTRLTYFREKNMIAYSYSSDSFRAMSLDVLIQSNLDFETCWGRKETKYLQGVPVYVLNVDDLIAMKSISKNTTSRMEPIKENEGIGFTYTVTGEQVRRHQALSPEEVLDWILQTATFIYDLQTPEERERKYIFKPNKRIAPELLRKDI